MFTLWLLHNSLPTLAPEASLWHAVGSQPGIVSARLDCDPGGRELSPDPIREGARSSEAAAGGGEREGRGGPRGAPAAASAAERAPHSSLRAAVHAGNREAERRPRGATATRKRVTRAEG